MHLSWVALDFCPLQKELRHSGLSLLAAPSSHKADESDLAYLTLLDHLHGPLESFRRFTFVGCFCALQCLWGSRDGAWSMLFLQHRRFNCESHVMMMMMMTSINMIQ